MCSRNNHVLMFLCDFERQNNRICIIQVTTTKLNSFFEIHAKSFHIDVKHLLALNNCEIPFILLHVPSSNYVALNYQPRRTHRFSVSGKKYIRKCATNAHAHFNVVIACTECRLTKFMGHLQQCKITATISNMSSEL